MRVSFVSVVVLSAVIICILIWCTTEPGIEAPGRPVDAAEMSSEGWKPIMTWTLVEVAPGTWFTLNTVLYGDGPFKRQFVNAVTVEGKPISVRCDGDLVTLKPVAVFTRDGNVARATLIMYTRGDGGTEYRYELSYPKR